MNNIFWVSFGVLWVLVVIQGFAFLEVLRQIGQIRKQLGPSPGALIVPGVVDTGGPLPELSGLSATGLRPAAWDDYLGTDLGVIIVFRPNCSSCRAMARELTGFASEVRDEARIVALVAGDVEEAQTFVREAGLDPHMAIIDVEGDTVNRLGVTFNPGAVTVIDRTLGHAAIVNSVDQIHALMHEEERADGGELAARPLGTPRSMLHQEA